VVVAGFGHDWLQANRSDKPKQKKTTRRNEQARPPQQHGATDSYT
jgi:hypothetical protein